MASKSRTASTKKKPRKSPRKKAAPSSRGLDALGVAQGTPEGEALAEQIRADVAIAEDPDADRCAVVCGGRQLTGDEVGALLADWLLRRGVRGTYASSLVSGSLMHVVAAAQGVPAKETTTGFK